MTLSHFHSARLGLLALCAAAFGQKARRPPQPRYSSNVSIFDICDKSTHTVYQADTVFEAPTGRTFFGGQGTIDVNSWSPDSKRFVDVIYELLPAAAQAH